MPNWSWTITALLCAAGIMTACGYGYRAFPVQPEIHQGWRLDVIQSDDYGSLWDPDHARELLNDIKAESQTANTVVVVFIHGWRHNADQDDCNLRDFNATLSELHDRFATQIKTAEDNIRIHGVYVGWRGKSAPTPLDLLTIWSRKPAAERIGEGDVSEFLARLQKIYEERKHEPTGPFMGLVLTGHSLGAQLLFKAVAPTLEHSLIQDTEAFAGTGVKAQKQAGLQKRKLNPVANVGDLVLLLNPALEAYQFQRFHRLYRQRDYDSGQDPVLFVVSSENDWPNKYVFPISRFLMLPFRAPLRDSTQAALFERSLGNYEEHLTHTLTLNSGGVAPNLCKGNPACLADEDLSGEVCNGQALLSPRSKNDRILFSPVVVARVSSEIVNGHNGIFGPVFKSFIGDYVAEIEFRRLMRHKVEKDKAQKFRK